jgi:hypothetical protein
MIQRRVNMNGIIGDEARRGAAFHVLDYTDRYNSAEKCQCMPRNSCAKTLTGKRELHFSV